MSAPNLKQKRERLPVIVPNHRGCGNCVPPQKTLHRHARIAVGFGVAKLTRDGETVYREDTSLPWDKLWTVQKAENLARKHPRSDWRIVLHGPLHGETYQRQGRNRWVCVESNQGFA